MSDPLDSIPVANVKRIVKAKLMENIPAGASEAERKGREVNVAKEALQAFGECAKIFIHYITATANDICHEARRSTISADDIMKAIEDTEFTEFIEPLKEALAAYKSQAGAKKAAEAGKKRKAESEAGGEGGGGEGGDGGEGAGDAADGEEEEGEEEAEEAAEPSPAAEEGAAEAAAAP